MARFENEFPVFDPGALRHKLVIEQPGSSQGASGAAINAWATFATVRAKVEPLGGTETLGAGAFNPEASHRITIRYLSGLTPDMRINWNGRYFDIANVNNVLERGRWMVISAREGRSHGSV